MEIYFYSADYITEKFLSEKSMQSCELAVPPAAEMSSRHVNVESYIRAARVAFHYHSGITILLR